VAFREANPIGGTICVEPFLRNGVDVRYEGGVAKVNQRDTLTGLKVVYGNDKFKAGDVVYFEGEQCAAFWAKRVYSLGETKFVLAPVDQVRVVERNETPYSSGPG
jgi:hypothetical protein